MWASSYHASNKMHLAITFSMKIENKNSSWTTLSHFVVQCGRDISIVGTPKNAILDGFIPFCVHVIDKRSDWHVTAIFIRKHISGLFQFISSIFIHWMRTSRTAEISRKLRWKQIARIFSFIFDSYCEWHPKRRVNKMKMGLTASVQNIFRLSFEIGAERRYEYHTISISITYRLHAFVSNWKMSHRFVCCIVIISVFLHSMLKNGTFWMRQVYPLGHFFIRPIQFKTIFFLQRFFINYKCSIFHSDIFRLLLRHSGKQQICNKCNSPLWSCEAQQKEHHFDDFTCFLRFQIVVSTPTFSVVTRNWHIYDNWMPSQSALAFENFLGSLYALSPQTIPSSPHCTTSSSLSFFHSKAFFNFQFATWKSTLSRMCTR